MLLLLVTSTFGVSLHRMKCLCTGNVEYSLYTPVDCMEDEHPGEPKMQALCCDFSEVTTRLEVESTIEPTFELEPMTFEVSWMNFFQLPVMEIAEQFFFSGLSPPTDSGMDLLIRICNFRI